MLLSSIALEHAKKLGYTIELNNSTEKLTDEQWADLFVGVEGLISTWNCPRLNADVLHKNTTLKIVGHAAGSVASTVSPYLYERGVKVTTSNNVMAEAVAEWSLMMTIFSLRKIAGQAQFGLNKGVLDWNHRRDVKVSRDAVIGIWGFGDVAKHLVNFLKPFCPKQILVSIDYLTNEQAKEWGVKKVSLDELFAQSDVIHLLNGLTDKTWDAIGEKQLGLIKEGATLINTGRAQLVQEEALLKELQKNHFKAILDVHHTSPLPKDSPFRNLDNVVLTPHNSGCGNEDLYVKCILDEFERFFTGKPLKYEITKERAETMTRDYLITGAK
jgi:phosphoglycerate dehydrogenase-like enzyme